MGYFIKSDVQSTVFESGPTSERPTTPVESVLRYNTDTNNFEFWNGTVFASLSVAGSTQLNVTRFTANGVDTIYTPLAASVNTAKEIIVYINGVLQEPTTHYTVSGTTLTLGSVVPNGELITVIHGIGNTHVTPTDAIDITL